MIDSSIGCQWFKPLARRGVLLAGLQVGLLIHGLAWWPQHAHAAELVTLSPENFETHAPRGKEADAVWADYVLRNEHIEATVADPTQPMGRSSSRRGNVIPGRLIDLTMRGRKDLLVRFEPIMYYPEIRSTPAPKGIVQDEDKQGQYVPAADRHTEPGRQPIRSDQVTLTLPYGDRSGREEDVCEEVRYTLADGWPYLQNEVVYRNNGKNAEPITVEPMGFLQMTERSYHSSGQVLYGDADMDSPGRVVWMYDHWFGGAIAVVSEGFKHAIHPQGRRAAWLLMKPKFEDKGSTRTLAPGEEWVLRRKLIPARNAFEARAIASKLIGETTHELELRAFDAQGPVANALVEAWRHKKLYAAGRTDAEGDLAFALPDGAFELRISSVANGIAQQFIEPQGVNEAIQIELQQRAHLAMAVTNGDNQPLPCTVQIRGVGETATPYLFSTDGSERVGNIIQSPNGSFEQDLQPGNYQLVITRGPEYDAVVRDIELAAGQRLELSATLERVVETPGWISATLYTPTTDSEFFSSATRVGRVMELLAEGIEFAPSTDHDKISTFKPIIRELDAEPWLATSDGVHLTQRVRKTFTAQNIFPMPYVRGDQDGGMPRRPQHVLQIWWISRFPFHLREDCDIYDLPGGERLIQITPPGIWPNDGRLEGESYLFDDRMNGPMKVIRNQPMKEMRNTHALDVAPLETFTNLAPWDPSDPKGEKAIDAWFTELDKRQANNWPDVPDRNLRWVDMLNLGYRVTGVVNDKPRSNYLALGRHRNYIASPTDDPSQIDEMAMLRAIKAGRVIMTTGPFVDASISASSSVQAAAGPGETVAAPSGRAELHVRIQSSNWIGVDRVAVHLNGRPAKALTFTRQSHPDHFGDGVAKFEQTIPLSLEHDTHVMVFASGDGPNHRKPLNAEEASDRIGHYALTNPIFVDVDGAGFQPHSPVDDKTYTRMDAQGTVEPGQTIDVRLHLKNEADVMARDRFSVKIIESEMVSPPTELDQIKEADPLGELMPRKAPPPAATIVGSNDFAYELEPGELKVIPFKLKLRAGQRLPHRITLRVERSSQSVGRRPVGLVLKSRSTLKYLEDQPAVNQRTNWWLPELNPYLPEEGDE